MPDPLKIYAEESQTKRDNLRLIWPDLHAALEQRRVQRAAVQPQCAAAIHAGRTAATGRVTLNGTPACSLHLRVWSDRVGGYPLEIVDPQTWSTS